MIRYVCDVEGCEETLDMGQNAMGLATTPVGWHEVVTQVEIDKQGMRAMGIPRQIVSRKMALMTATRRLVCSKHPMPKWKGGSGEEDDLGFVGAIEQ